MGNRKQPFGYKMSLGEIVIQESEAKLVQEVFRRYIAGESLNELTEALRQQDVPYDEGRLWNKNMVARILADARYTGEKEYPKLIDKEQLIAANEKRSNKPQLPKKTEAQKVLRRLCGTPPSEQVEQSVTDLLNGLANCPDRIRHQRSPTPATHSKTQETLDNALEQQPIDEDNAKALILRLAAEQYAALGDEEYETNRLRRLFSAFECVAELNADLLKRKKLFGNSGTAFLRFRSVFIRFAKTSECPGGFLQLCYGIVHYIILHPFTHTAPPASGIFLPIIDAVLCSFCQVV